MSFLFQKTIKHKELLQNIIIYSQTPITLKEARERPCRLSSLQLQI